MGTILVSAVSQITGSVNLGVGALSVMFLAGFFLFFESGQNRKKRGRTRKSRRTFSAAWIGSVIYAKNAFAALSRYSVSLTPAVSYGECIAS